jgi:hypothetical protein
MTDSPSALSPHPTGEGLSVRFADRVLEGITSEVLSEFNAVPRRGTEAGGILLGRYSGTDILVEDFEPVLCEHRFGPSFHLSDEDLCGLRESLDWFRDPARCGVEVLGFYRSEIHAGFEPSEEDRGLIRHFLGPDGPLFLLLKPDRKQSIEAALFVMVEGTLRAAGAPAAFPFDAPVRLVPPVEDSPAVEPWEVETPIAEEPAEQRRLLVPPVHPQRLIDSEETKPRASARQWWIAGVAALTIAALLLGYRSVGHRHAAPPQPASSTLKSEPPAAERQARPQAPPPGYLPVADSVIEEEIRGALDRWTAALRTGNPDQIAASYTPQMERYFNQRDASDASVRRAVAEMTARYGKMAIVRLSEINIVPLSTERALATFRKHWQTGGPHIFAGEEQERLTFVKLSQGWRIASEQETKVYWTHR